MTPKEAFEYAEQYGPSDKTREIACEHPEFAYLYAENIDKYPRGDMRQAACKNSLWAYYYAAFIDKYPENTEKLHVKVPFCIFICKTCETNVLRITLESRVEVQTRHIICI